MEKEDYLLKQIEQLGRVLGKLLSYLLGIKNSGQISQAVNFANKSLKSELNFDIDNLLLFDNEEFINILTANQQFSNSNLETFADIILNLADEYYIVDNEMEKAMNLYQKSLKIYKYLNQKDLTFSFERQMKIEKINQLSDNFK